VIISKLRASNVLKYSQLEINDIPSKGQIAICGPNESGKTTIVESICFALFGRTFSLGPENITKIIRWGEQNCEVDLEFIGTDRRAYRINRSLDDEGTHSARLYHGGESEPFAIGPATVQDAIVNACGFDYPQYLDALYLAQREISAPHSQSDTIKAIAGTVELESIIKDLRIEVGEAEQEIQQIDEIRAELKQRMEELAIDEQAFAAVDADKIGIQQQIEEGETEITRMKEASKDLQTGFKKLIDANNEFNQAPLHETALTQWRLFGTQFEKSLQTLQSTCFPIKPDHRICSDNALTEFARDFKQRLNAFDAVRLPLSALRARLGYLLGEPSQSMDTGVEEAPIPMQLDKARGHLFRTRIRRVVTETAFILSALVTIAIWAGWWLFKFPTSSQHTGRAANWLGENFTWWHSDILFWSLPAAIVLTILTAFLWFKSARTISRIKKQRGALEQIERRLAATQSHANAIESVDSDPFTKVAQGLHKLNDEDIDNALELFETDQGNIFVHDKAHAHYKASLTTAIDEGKHDLNDLREYIAVETGRIAQTNEERRASLERLDEKLADLHARQQQVEELSEKIDEKNAEIAHHDDYVRLRRLARKLAMDTCRNIYLRFNGVLTKYTSAIMPKLTDGRYQQMQIDDDLNVRVFSTEKNDFAELDELSSGTQRQMLLAVRLAVAKALTEATQTGKQFIILDEPFAFFDRERINSTLKALPNVDNQMKQIWIIAQEFESRYHFKQFIACSRDANELIVGKASAPQRLEEETGTVS
jgi:DNA repair exonuclease SbcCD ATPase subunit